MKIFIFLLIILNFFFTFPAVASVCRLDNQHNICLVSVKRSAKYYWQYIVSISVDGVKQPQVIYKCRARLKIYPDGSLVPFQSNDYSETICNLNTR